MESDDMIMDYDYWSLVRTRVPVFVWSEISSESGTGPLVGLDQLKVFVLHDVSLMVQHVIQFKVQLKVIECSKLLR